MTSILVSGASGIVGYGILRTLRKSSLQLKLIGITIYEDSVAQNFCDVFEKAPPTSNPGYIAWLVEVIRKYHVDMIIPGIEADMYCWLKHKEILQKTGVALLLNDTELISLCEDKWSFYKVLCENNLSCAIDTTLERDFHALEARLKIPFLLKPRSGFGSKGIVRVNHLDDFLIHQNRMGDILMAQPIVGSEEEEYTVSAFCDGVGDFFAIMALRRKLSKDGFTEKAEVVSYEIFEKVVRRLCGIFRPIGPTNFQFRVTEHEIKLLEINPRISSSTSIRAAFGYNESEMVVRYFLQGESITQPVIKEGKAIRYMEDCIFYENSTDI